MTQVVPFAEAEARQMRRKLNTKYPFLSGSPDKPDNPVAFLLRDKPERTTPVHYHAVDQFQVVVDGSGKFGRHDMVPYSIHFSRVYTPYGPLLPDSPRGWSFLALRARVDPGAHFFPESKEDLKRIPGRNPWQVSRQITFPAGRISHDVELRHIPDIQDDQGLFACTLRMPPNSVVTAPDPARGDGQYIVITSGSLRHDGSEHQGLTIVFIEPEGPPFELNAGADGLAAIVMNFPRIGVPRRAAGKAAATTRWQCEMCAFSYDETLGLPADGIPAGTRWAEVPNTWTCPDCSATKSDFKQISNS